MKLFKSTPNHVAIIMDGNGTWSKKNNLHRKDGHKKGVVNAKKIITYTIDNNVKNLTLFALSNENLSRSKLELKNLFDIFFHSFAEEKDFLATNNIRIQFIGNIKKLPKKLQDKASALEIQTKKNKKLNLFIALNYGGKQDIKQAIKKLVEANKKNDKFENYLFSRALPEVDLLIRTGGYKRLSNFIIWHTSYAEMYFTDTLWPSFTKRNYCKALDWYKNINRKFGKT